MPTKTIWKNSNLWLLLGLVAFFGSHLPWLGRLPGLHFDEAWAANYAWRIAFEDRFWPWQAMSAYTAPWAHYVGALFFRVFGVDVFWFRVSQLSCAAAGVGLTAWAIRIQYANRAWAAWLPWVLAVWPGTYFNHRFAIELNGFHVFCFGLVCLGLARRQVSVLVPGLVLGVTSHALFLGVAMGLLLAYLYERSAVDDFGRRSILIACTVLAPFYLLIASQIPEQKKSWALAALNILTILWILTNPARIKRIVTYWKWLFWITALPFLVFAFNLLVFACGGWHLTKQIGAEISLGWFLVPAIVVTGLIFMKLKLSRQDVQRVFALRWFYFSLVVLGSIGLTQAPRYYELALLALGCGAAFGLAQCTIRHALLQYFAWLLVVVLVAMNFYFVPGKSGYQIYAKRRFLGIKDSSRDFVPVWPVLHHYARVGCGPAQFKSPDHRLETVLQFYRKTNLVINQIPCLYRELIIERRAESNLNAPVYLRNFTVRTGLPREK